MPVSRQIRVRAVAPCQRAPRDYACSSYKRVYTATMLLTVVVADAQRMTALRDGLPTPGRVLRYPTSNLVSVFESIRANQPGLIILDAIFLKTPAGHSFVERIKQLPLPKLVLQAAMFDRGRWIM